ncbi:hypothetical protein N5079_06465 [Planotetraspora sp. A-T 1434]|uniref:hypothetical protein n=1 Tax=Planotetraspora sp. A-T 1434 TaxID=2979219 RepID=UPI0021C0066B|nr:hypothetical protein [Planotetraspora sp. A-T 1434]MCT9929860.1 hypothetical protein [Planotetraspora sp. A-T 1434]
MSTPASDVGEATRLGPARNRRPRATTRNRLAAWAALLLVLFVATSGTGLLADRAVRAAGQEMATSAAQMSDNAQAIYRSLSGADTAATGRFLAMASPRQRDELDRRYGEALSVARQRLADSSALTGGDPERAAGLARISRQLPVYTGLVDHAQDLTRYARTDPKRALLGAAYLREATAYLRGTLLPAALDLWKEEIARLGEARNGARVAIGSLTALLVLTLGALWGIQRYLWRRTRRVFNRGLALATLVMLGTLGWLVWSLSASPYADVRLGAVGERLRAQQDLVGVERAALEARADDYLRLGGDSTAVGSNELRSRFRGNAGCDHPERPLSGALTRRITIWCATYDQEIHEKERGGRHEEAVVAALPDGKVAVAYEQFDADLTRAIENGKAAILDLAEDIPVAPEGLGSGTVLLCLAAALCAGRGIWIRIKDYL